MGCTSEILRRELTSLILQVAKESAAKFNPHIKLEAHHANIKDHQYNIDWFQSFGLVFNALDNLDARRHVNKMCLAAQVPLVESGTTGFNGQVQVIVKVRFRSGPKHIWLTRIGQNGMLRLQYKGSTKKLSGLHDQEHPESTDTLHRLGEKLFVYVGRQILTIARVMLIFSSEMFGTSEDEAQQFDHSEDADNGKPQTSIGVSPFAHLFLTAKELENLRQESQALNSIRQAMGSEDFPRKVFEKVFRDDINRLRSMEDMWKTRKRPTALDFDALSQNASSTKPVVASQDQKAWTDAENFTVFCDSLHRLSTRLQQAQASNSETNSVSPILSFDKDDTDTLDFVTAAANLRSIIFGIEPKSKFEIKQMAGNIIPAIATTNAMTAGLCVMQAFKIMREDLSKARMVFLERSGARVINSDSLKPPNPSCTVCGVTQARLTIDPERATLNHLVDDVLRKQLGYSEEIMINNEIGTIYDPDLDDNLPKKFGELGVKADSFVTIIDDEDENPRVNLSLSISEK